MIREFLYVILHAWKRGFCSHFALECITTKASNFYQIAFLFAAGGGIAWVRSRILGPNTLYEIHFFQKCSNQPISQFTILGIKSNFLGYRVLPNPAISSNPNYLLILIDLKRGEK